MKLAPNIDWQPPESWATREWPKNAHSVLVVVELRDGSVCLEEVYALGDRRFLNRPLHTFETPVADAADWKRFAVVCVRRMRPKKKPARS